MERAARAHPDDRDPDGLPVAHLRQLQGVAGPADDGRTLTQPYREKISSRLCTTVGVGTYDSGTCWGKGGLGKGEDVWTGDGADKIIKLRASSGMVTARRHLRKCVVVSVDLEEPGGIKRW